MVLLQALLAILDSPLAKAGKLKVWHKDSNALLIILKLCAALLRACASNVSAAVCSRSSATSRESVR